MAKRNLGYLSEQERQIIYDCMSQKRISQGALAYQSGISYNHLSRVINGKAPISFNVSNSLYRILGIEIPKGGISTSFDQPLNTLFEGYVRTLYDYYKRLNQEEKLKLLQGLEDLVKQKSE